MSDENIFNSDKTPADDGDKSPPKAPEAFGDLVGEGKKYATIEKALEALAHGQSHIAKLEGENKELREVANKAKSMDEVYEAVKAKLASERDTPAATSGLDPAQLEAKLAEMLDRKTAEREATAKAKANTDIVRNAIVEKFGEKSQEVYEAKAKELGITTQWLNDMVKASPKAALELFGLKTGTPAAIKPTFGSINTAALANQPKQPEKPKSVMFGATTQDITEAWKAAAPKRD